jgi:hypothetical protein
VPFAKAVIAFESIVPAKVALALVSIVSWSVPPFCILKLLAPDPSNVLFNLKLCSLSPSESLSAVKTVSLSV